MSVSLRTFDLSSRKVKISTLIESAFIIQCRIFRSIRAYLAIMVDKTRFSRYSLNEIGSALKIKKGMSNV